MREAEVELTTSLRGHAATLQELAAVRLETKKTQAQLLGLMKLCRAQQAEVKELRGERRGDVATAAAGGEDVGEAVGGSAAVAPGSLGASGGGADGSKVGEGDNEPV